MTVTSRNLGALSSNGTGALFMTLSMASFVFNDTLMKVVLQDLPLFQSIFLRGIFATVFMAVFCKLRGAFIVPGGPIRAVAHPMVLLRTLGEVGGTYFFLTALKHLPIANVTAVLQILPLTITLAAALFLGEKVGWRRYGAILIGFIGVLLIIRPGPDGFNVFAIYAVIATLFITLRDLATRKLPETTPSLLVSLVTAFVVMLLGLSGMVVRGWEPVTLTQVALLGAAAAIIIGGYVFSILAMRVGEVSFVAPFRYSILLWAIALGFIVFGDVPDTIAVIGAILIVGSGLFSFYRERQLEKR